MAALRNGSKCSHTTCMLRFFTVSRLALNPNLIFEIGSYKDVRFLVKTEKQIPKASQVVNRHFHATFHATSKNCIHFGPICPRQIAYEDFRSLILSVSSGTKSSMSSTIPTSANWNIGALGFLFMATTNGAPLIPPRCWNDPLIPRAK